MTYYSALCVSLYFNQQLITKGTVFSERELKFMFAIMSSSVRLSVVCRL